MENPPVYAGVDACSKGWVAVLIDDERFLGAHFASKLENLFLALGDAETIGVDMPIGLRASGRRSADIEARSLLGRCGSSVFAVPARPLLQARTYSDARALAQELGEPGVTAQAFALRSKIFELDPIARIDSRVREVHPELAFYALAGDEVVVPGKKSWAGSTRRRSLLDRAGIRIPDELGAAGLMAGADDVLDAAAAAWSARRIAHGEARFVPVSVQLDTCRNPMRIYF